MSVRWRYTSSLLSSPSTLFTSLTRCLFDSSTPNHLGPPPCNRTRRQLPLPLFLLIPYILPTPARPTSTLPPPSSFTGRRAQNFFGEFTLDPHMPRCARCARYPACTSVWIMRAVVARAGRRIGMISRGRQPQTQVCVHFGFAAAPVPGRVSRGGE